MKCYAFIPARGGSKGIHKKNHSVIGSKPLYQITIDLALESNEFEKIIVSTDDKEILNSHQDKNVVLIERPPEISQDSSPTSEALDHALSTLDIRDGLYVILQCTSPFRRIQTIKDGIKLLKSNPSHLIIGGSIASDNHPARMYFEDTSGEYKPLNKKNEKLRRQDLPKVIHRNGLFYGSNIKDFLESKIIMLDKKKFIFSDEIESINIDSELDLDFARFVAQRNEKNKKI